MRPSRDWRADHSRLLQFLRSHLAYPVVFAALSGGDLYGFPSDDGDYDLRVSHVLPTRALIVSMLNEGGMDRVADITVTALDKNVFPEMDFVSHDIGKFLRLALKGNGYVLEQLLSPLVVETSKWHEELKALSSGLITRRVYHHYRGFFTNQEKLYNNIGTKRVKGLLYQYRVALTGIHALETGEIEPNILRLNDRFNLSSINDLVSLKVNGEAAFLGDDAPYLAEIESLEPKLNAAYEKSPLPLQVPIETRQAIEDFLLRCRNELGK
ncbi:MAG: nucleotidyltransferase domain-containing protein [Chloroflexi bacterium]|nr:nucleotidyltransferase domain-containing protein [Chloroflexota bacterium]